MPSRSKPKETATLTVAIETDLDTVLLWERARALEPSCLTYARFLRGTTTPEGFVQATVEVDADHYDYLVAALGIEMAPSALEAELTHDAAEVVEPVELEEELAKIPVAIGTTVFSADTFTVSWSVADTVYVWEELAITDTDLKSAAIVRTGRDGDSVRLAVTLPAAVANKVRAAYRELEDGDEVNDPVLDTMRSILWPLDETYRWEGGALSFDDDEIPF
jgi:hypothetical protein